MTGPDRDERLEQLLRDHLERRDQAIDPAPVLARIRASLPRLPRPRSQAFQHIAQRAPQRWRWVGGLVAASLLLGLLAGLSVAPVRASAEMLVKESRRVHAQPLERCYLIEVRREAGPGEASELSSGPMRVWTRGDRFWVDFSRGPFRSAWGRDEQGSVWLAMTPRRGVRIAAEEVGRPLALTCELHSLQVDTLFDQILRHCTLEESPATPGTLVRTVTARPRRLFAWLPLRQAELEIDSETKVLRRLVLTRVVQQVRVTTTFTLLETRAAEDARYSLEGHLKAPYEIYDREHQPLRRREALKRWLGPRAIGWIREP